MYNGKGGYTAWLRHVHSDVIAYKMHTPSGLSILYAITPKCVCLNHYLVNDWSNQYCY